MENKENVVDENVVDENVANAVSELDVDNPKGAFVASLVRNNSKIRKDRAAVISEDTDLVYKRLIEDLELSIRKMRREQENMLDLSPTDSRSLVLASDFDSSNYVNTDIDLAVKIRNTQIKLDLAKERYEYLFKGGN